MTPAKGQDGDGPASAPELIEVHAEGVSALALEYDDGTSGHVDVSRELSAGGVFEALRDPAVFARVRLGEYGQVVWPGGVEMCADALYLRLTNRVPGDIFPGLSRQRADA